MAWRLRLRRERPDLNFRQHRPQNLPTTKETPPVPAPRLPSTEKSTHSSCDSSSENQDSEGEDSDSSTVGTTAKRRLRIRHKLRFRRSREEVFAQQYVYKVLAESNIYSECKLNQNRQFHPLEVTLLVLKAMRKLDICYKQAMLGSLSHCPETVAGGPQATNLLHF